MRQILPPTTGCSEPRTELTGDRSPLRVIKKGEPWPVGRPLRAGVSAMGFGGINAHVVLESIDERRRVGLSPGERTLLDSSQDAELFLLEGRDVGDLRRQVVELLEMAGQLSMAEMTDLAAHLAGSVSLASWEGEAPSEPHVQKARTEPRPPRDGSGARAARAAIVAGRPAELVVRLESLRERLDQEFGPVSGNGDGRPDGADVFLGLGKTAPRIGFLFPGQGRPRRWMAEPGAAGSRSWRSSTDSRASPRRATSARPTWPSPRSSRPRWRRWASCATWASTR